MTSSTTIDHASTVTGPATYHDPVHHPSHYCNHPSGIECIEITRRLFFDLGNCVKYVWRRGEKGNPAQDLDKALFYLTDARTHNPRFRDVPVYAAKLLIQVSKADPNPLAAKFYRAVAGQSWPSAEKAIIALREELEQTT